MARSEYSAPLRKPKPPVKRIFKGPEYSLRAMQKLDELKVDYEYIVVGSNAEAQTLLKQYPIKHLKLIGMVPQDNLKQYLSEADIYLFPSLCEGCASSGMEAMAAGLPVIATVESGLPITNEKNGLVIESKRVDDIVDAILNIYNVKLYHRIYERRIITSKSKDMPEIPEKFAETFSLL